MKHHVVVPLLSTKKSSKTVLHDDEFGEVICRRHHIAKYVRLRITADGQLIITMPKRAPMSAAEHLLNDSRVQIRGILQKQPVSSRQNITDGTNIGHSHVVRMVDGPVDVPVAKLEGLQIILTKPVNLAQTDDSVQSALLTLIDKALQKEARAYLPRRLQYLAEQYGYDYDKVRFGTQKGRWGSCSSSGTISLNIGLMNLPVELIDYVLIHELCHTKQMNHSKEFWILVENCLPDYKQRRKLIKNETPTH